MRKDSREPSALSGKRKAFWLKAYRLPLTAAFLIAYSLPLIAVFTGCATAGAPPAEPPALEEARRQIHLTGNAPLKAGMAKVEITPSVGTPLAGYAKRRGRPSQGIRDPLYARVLTLSDGEDLLVIVSADLLIFPQPMADALVKRIQREHQVNPQAIVLAATHTHSGPGAIAPGFLYELVFGRYERSVEEGIAARISWAVGQAIRDQRPARWGTGEEKSLKGLTENRMNPSDLADPALRVFLVTSEVGEPMAILVNASAHPTLLEPKDLRFSADYPGEVCRILEAAYPGALALFVNGASGDLRPKDALGADPEERISRFGSALAEASTGLLSQISVRSHTDLAAWGRSVPLPTPRLRLGPILIHPMIGRLMRPSRTRLNLLALDGFLFVPLPAELTHEAGQELKAKLVSAGRQSILVGYANGYLGYAVTPLQYKLASYEAKMSWYGPSFAQLLADHLQQLAGLYPKKKKP